jgi:hypothetical protein
MTGPADAAAANAKLDLRNVRLSNAMAGFLPE